MSNTVQCFCDWQSQVTPLKNYEIDFEAATDGRRADGVVGDDDALVADPVLLAAVAAPAAAQGHGARRRRGRGRDGRGGRQLGLGKVAQQEEEALRWELSIWPSTLIHIRGHT